MRVSKSTICFGRKSALGSGVIPSLRSRTGPSIKTNLSYALIIYICAFLAVGPFVAGLSAKIAPKTTEEEVGIVTIVKGDTLWDLAIKYFQDPLLWKEFKKYNDFTDPNLIYPGEKMQLPEQILLPTGVARQIASGMILTMGATKADLDEITKKYDKKISELKSASENVKSIEMELAKLRKENQVLKEQLRLREDQLQQLLQKIKEQGAQSENAQEQIRKLESSLASQQTSSQSVQKQIDKLEESLGERSMQVQIREEELTQLSNEIKDHTEKLDISQENIAKLQKKIEEAEANAEEEDASKRPADDRESKLAVATAIVGGVILFALGVLSR